MTTHGHTTLSAGRETKVYRAWRAIKERCFNCTCKMYARYGGRGILVYSGWVDSFEDFLKDVGEPPENGRKYSLERINNSKGYEPGNCKWATSKEQANNRSDTVHLTLNGVTKTISQWAEITGLKYATIKRRKMVLGWSDEQTLTIPKMNCGRKFRDLPWTKKD